MKYAQDERTREQMKKNYDRGKEMEEKIIKKLKTITPTIQTNEDKRGETTQYEPDAFVWYRGGWRMLEIKRSEKELSGVQRKLNQYNVAKKLDGYLLICCPKGCQLISPYDSNREIEKGYCNKPVIEYRANEWSRLDCLF